MANAQEKSVGKPVKITMRDGKFLFPTPTAQQDYLKGLDPFKCAPVTGGRTIGKSKISQLPMVEEIRSKRV